MGNAIALCPTEGLENQFQHKFEVDESQTIGSGKFSEVYLCWRKRQPEKRYALKVINFARGDSANVERIYGRR